MGFQVLAASALLIVLVWLLLWLAGVYDRSLLLVEYRWKVQRCPECGRSCFARRRRAMLRMIGKGGIAILPSAPMRLRNRDVEYPYRQDSDFFYLTGFAEPDAVLVLIPSITISLSALRMRDKAT